MKIRPLHDWAVIRRLDAGEMTTGGIIIPVVAREKPAEGIIEAIGPGKYIPKGKGTKEKFVPTTVKPGQRVVFANYAARDTEVDGQQVTFVREEDILGTREGESRPVLKEPHAVSVRAEKPLLVTGKPAGGAAAAPKQKKTVSASRASEKKGGARKTVEKKPARTAVLKKNKPAKSASKKKAKDRKKGAAKPGKSPAGAKKTLKKTVKKTVRGTGRKTVQVKARVNKAKGISKNTVAKKKKPTRRSGS
jgi:chaperonin GroES